MKMKILIDLGQPLEKVMMSNSKQRTHNVDDTNNEFGPSFCDDQCLSSPHGPNKITCYVDDTDSESRPSPREGHGMSSPLGTSNRFDNREAHYIYDFGPSIDDENIILIILGF